METATLTIPPELVERIAVRAAELVEKRDDDRWMNAREAAEYLAVPVSTIHKLTADQTIPFSQDVAGGKLYFRRSKLDAWREHR